VMVEKVKLESLCKNALRSVFVFEKSWDVIDAIDKIRRLLGFTEPPEHNIKDLIYGSRGPGPKLKIDEFVDKVYGMENKDYFINVFIGKEKVILVVRSSEDRQPEISEAVFEFADFKEDLK